jgi:hypothetical protein
MRKPRSVCDRCNGPCPDRLAYCRSCSLTVVAWNDRAAWNAREGAARDTLFSKARLLGLKIIAWGTEHQDVTIVAPDGMLFAYNESCRMSGGTFPSWTKMLREFDHGFEPMPTPGEYI